jgi:hypothetical protein
MRSRINSTSREKIDSHMAAFDVTAKDDGTAQFHAHIDLSELGLPKDGEVIVEAYRQSQHERFPFGTVNAITPAYDTSLRELGAEGIRFRVKVAEPNTGRLLARGDKFGTSEPIESGRRELLRVVVRDLGQEPWKTELYDDGAPVLVLNEYIPGALAKLSTDPVFRSLILPGALRQILLMMWLKKVEDEDDGDGDDHWAADWIRFGEKITGDDKPDWSDDIAASRWIDEVCRAFSAHYRLITPFDTET